MISAAAFAKKGYPFRATTLALSLVQQTCNAIAPNQISTNGLDEEAAKAISRINAMRTKNGGRDKPIALTERSIPSRLDRVAQHIKDSKVSFFKSAVYWSFFLDESTTTTCSSRPCYVCAIGTTEDFRWSQCYAGQYDTSSHTSGKDNLRECKAVLETFWGNPISIGVDGCAAMRSKVDSAGVDMIVRADGSRGHSFAGRWIDATDGKPPFIFHRFVYFYYYICCCCVTMCSRAWCILPLSSPCHIINLAIQDSVKSTVPACYIGHVQKIATYFRASANRTHTVCTPCYTTFTQVLSILFHCVHSYTCVVTK